MSHRAKGVRGEPGERCVSCVALSVGGRILFNAEAQRLLRRPEGACHAPMRSKPGRDNDAKLHALLRGLRATCCTPREIRRAHRTAVVERRHCGPTTSLARRPERTVNPFGIYVHWPFCAAKCPYCDFNSHVRSAIDEDALDRCGSTRELDWVRAAQGNDGSHGRDDLLRRRHAVASLRCSGGPTFRDDAAACGRRHHDLEDPSARWKPIRPAPRRRGFAIIAPPASIASRSAFRR